MPFPPACASGGGLTCTLRCRAARSLALMARPLRSSGLGLLVLCFLTSTLCGCAAAAWAWFGVVSTCSCASQAASHAAAVSQESAAYV